MAGAATVAAIALSGTARPIIPTDDTDFVNDNGQTSGDTFTNEHDQSTS